MKYEVFLPDIWRKNIIFLFTYQCQQVKIRPQPTIIIFLMLALFVNVSFFSNDQNIKIIVTVKGIKWRNVNFYCRLTILQLIYILLLFLFAIHTGIQSVSIQSGSLLVKSNLSASKINKMIETSGQRAVLQGYGSASGNEILHTKIFHYRIIRNHRASLAKMDDSLIYKFLWVQIALSKLLYLP